MRVMTRKAGRTFSMAMAEYTAVSRTRTRMCPRQGERKVWQKDSQRRGVSGGSSVVSIDNIPIRPEGLVINIDG